MTFLLFTKWTRDCLPVCHARRIQEHHILNSKARIRKLMQKTMKSAPQAFTTTKHTQCSCWPFSKCPLVSLFQPFFDMEPSFEAWETHRCLKNRFGIVCARGGGLLDHPYAPCHPPSVPPTEEHLVGHLTNYCHQMSSCGLLYILFLYCISTLWDTTIDRNCQPWRWRREKHISQQKLVQ